MWLPPFLIIKIFSHIIMSFLQRCSATCKFRLCLVFWWNPRVVARAHCWVRLRLYDFPLSADIPTRNCFPSVGLLNTGTMLLRLHFHYAHTNGKIFGGLPWLTSTCPVGNILLNSERHSRPLATGIIILGEEEGLEICGLMFNGVGHCIIGLRNCEESKVGNCN